MKKLQELIESDEKRIERAGSEYCRRHATDAQGRVYSQEAFDRTKYLRTQRLANAYNEVYSALRSNCLADIPNIIRALSERERNYLAAQLALNLPREVGLGMDYLDGVYYYLRIARTAKIFKIRIGGDSYTDLAKRAIKDLGVCMKNPSYYGQSKKALRSLRSEIRHEFGISSNSKEGIEVGKTRMKSAK